MKKEKKKNGRPTKYKPEYCQQMIDYFSIAHTRIDVIETISKSGASQSEKTSKRASKEVTTREKVQANTLPTFNKFAMMIRVDNDTLTEWKKVHPNFSLAYKECKALAENMLCHNALNGFYNPAFAIFYAKNNTSMRNDPLPEDDDCSVEFTSE